MHESLSFTWMTLNLLDCFIFRHHLFITWTHIRISVVLFARDKSGKKKQIQIKITTIRCKQLWFGKQFALLLCEMLLPFYFIRSHSPNTILHILCHLVACGNFFGAAFSYSLERDEAWQLKRAHCCLWCVCTLYMNSDTLIGIKKNNKYNWILHLCVCILCVCKVWMGKRLSYSIFGRFLHRSHFEPYIAANEYMYIYQNVPHIHETCMQWPNDKS